MYWLLTQNLLYHLFLDFFFPISLSHTLHLSSYTLPSTANPHHPAYKQHPPQSTSSLLSSPLLALTAHSWAGCIMPMACSITEKCSMAVLFGWKSVSWSGWNLSLCEVGLFFFFALHLFFLSKYSQDLYSEKLATKNHWYQRKDPCTRG